MFAAQDCTSLRPGTSSLWSAAPHIQDAPKSCQLFLQNTSWILDQAIFILYLDYWSTLPLFRPLTKNIFPLHHLNHQSSWYFSFHDLWNGKIEEGGVGKGVFLGCSGEQSCPASAGKSGRTTAPGAISISDSTGLIYLLAAGATNSLVWGQQGAAWKSQHTFFCHLLKHWTWPMPKIGVLFNNFPTMWGLTSHFHCPFFLYSCGKLQPCLVL